MSIYKGGHSEAEEARQAGQGRMLKTVFVALLALVVFGGIGAAAFYTAPMPDPRPIPEWRGVPIDGFILCLPDTSGACAVMPPGTILLLPKR